MSTFIHLMPQTLEDTAEVAAAEVQPRPVLSAKRSTWDLESFAEDQIRGLVRELYLTGSQPSRQVVFSAIDEETEISALCRRVAETLSESASGTTCLVDANLQNRRVSTPEGQSFLIHSDQQRFGWLRDLSLQLSGNLWHMPAEVFLGEPADRRSASWLRSRLAELRLEFDSLVLQAPAAGKTNQAAQVARLCDGLVLVLKANSTRRASAQKVKEMLDAAHVRLLGTVLCERKFPIPSAIYKRV